MMLLIALVCASLLLWSGSLVRRPLPGPETQPDDRSEEAFVRSVSMLLVGGTVWMLVLVVFQAAPGRSTMLAILAIAAAVILRPAVVRCVRSPRVAAAVAGIARWLAGSPGGRHE